MSSDTATDLFAQRWDTYRQVVDLDLMEHRALATATAAALEAWLQARPPSASAPRLVDLGCGDLAQLAPLLRRLPLAHYTGLDLCAEVLPRAAAQLGGTAYACSWCQLDLLAWALDPGAAQQPAVQLVHSAYAVHHLSDPDKQRFLAGLRSRLAPDGLFLWADVFREPGESREQYLERYRQRIHQHWHALAGPGVQQVIDHISRHDLPADGRAIQRLAEASGWSWQWLWRGSHRAEALALLTPRP